MATGSETGIRGVYHRKGHRTLAVELSVAPTGGTLGIHGDGVDVAVPLRDLEVGGGGWRGEAVHLLWTDEQGPASVTIDDRASLERLAAVLPADLAAAVGSLLAGVRARAWRSRVLLLVPAVIVLLPFALVAGLVLYPGPVLDLAVAQVPTSVDRAIGDMVERQLGDARRVTDPVVVGAVRQTGTRLLEAIPPNEFTFRFHVLRDPAINAFAAPGGVVVLHTGLLQAAESAEEVAGVMAHEIAHVLERHSMRQLCYRVGVWASLGLLFGSPDAAVTVLGDAASDLASLGFSRDQEWAADRRGLEILRAARVDPRGMVAFFEKLAAQGGAPPELLSTHPHSESRARAIETSLRALGAFETESIGVDWSAVRRALR